jgi:hypothetical protein
MRSEKTFPKNPFSEDFIYEGKGQLFLDRSAVPGRTYFYSVFAKYASGKVSNGSVVMIEHKGASISPLESDVGVSVGAGSPIYQYPESTLWQDGLGYLEFIQNGKSISFVQNRVVVDGKFETTVSLSGKAVFNPKSTIFIYVYDKDDPIPSDVYVMSRNQETGSFDVTLKAFIKTQHIPFKIFISESDGSRKRIEGTFEVKGSQGVIESVFGFQENLGDFYTYIVKYFGLAFILLVPLFLWIVIILLRLRAKREEKEHKDGKS